MVFLGAFQILYTDAQGTYFAKSRYNGLKQVSSFAEGINSEAEFDVLPGTHAHTVVVSGL
jgi:hypothetical protein